MANQMTVINNTSADPRNWKVNYSVDGAGLSIATLETAGTFVDRNIQIAITTPAGNATVSGGDLSVAQNYSATPTIDLTLDAQTTTGITIADTAPATGYYVQLSGKTSALSGITTVNRAATTLQLTSGYISQELFPGAITSSSISPTVTISSASQIKYLRLPTATFTTSGASIYSSAAGWVPAGSAINSITVGNIEATTAAITNGIAVMAPSGFATTSTGSYYLTLNTTPGSVTPKAAVITSGYVTDAQDTNGSPVSVPINGEGDRVYIASNTITGSVVNLSSGSVKINTSTSGITTTSTQTNYSITVNGTVTSGKVQGRATAGNTTGIVASGTINTSTSSTITPTVTGATTIYIPAATIGMEGLELVPGAGSASLSNSSGYYNGTSYDTTDKIELSTTQASGYYKLVSYGSGRVSQTALNTTLTSGYIEENTITTTATSTASNTSSVSYYVKKSSINNSITTNIVTATPATTSQTYTISSGYYPTDRTITVNAMTTGVVTPNYTNNNLSTYFNSTGATTGSISITPRYSNTSGYIAAHTNAAGTASYWNIKTTTLAQGATTTSGTTATRGTASISTSGWIEPITIPAATFSNTGSTGISYIDISNTTDAPILTSDGYLYINKGYVDNLQISLARLIPDDANVASSATMLQGTTAYDSAGKLWTGSIPSKAAATYNTSSSNQTISSGQYLAGTQTIRAVTTSGIDTGNIKSGVNILVGDSANSGRIKNVTGTFTDSDTVSTGQTAAEASQMLTGYSAWVDGAEVKGNIPIRTSASLNTSGNTITVSSGYYAENVSTTIGAGAYSATASQVTSGTITPSVSINSATTYGFTTATPTAGTYLTINPGASVTTKWKARATAEITTSGYLTTGSKTNDFEGTPGIAAGTNYYVPIVTPGFSGGTVNASISSNTITTNMSTATTGTHYIDAVASGSYTRSAVIYTNSAGVIAAHSNTTASAAIGSTAMGNKAATRVYVPDATFAVSTTGAVAGTATMTPTGFQAASSGATYYVTLNTTSGSIVPRVNVNSDGYITAGMTCGTATNITVDGNGDKLYIPTNTISGSVVELSSGSVAITTTTTGIVTTTGSTPYSITIGRTITNGSVKGKATAGATTGIVAANSSATSNASTITPSVTGTKTIYIQPSQLTVEGGAITVGSYTGIPTLSFSSNNNSNMLNTHLGNLSTATYPYYFEIKSNSNSLSGEVPFSVTKITTTFTSGYIEAGTNTIGAVEETADVTINASSATTYLSLKEAQAEITGTNIVTPTLSVTSANVTFSNTNNGISIVATGGGTAQANAVVETSQAGYVGVNIQMDDAIINASSATTSTTKYISGVKLEAPTSGTRSFTITVPNGSTSEFIDFVFTVDSSGNVTVDGN